VSKAISSAIPVLLLIAAVAVAGICGLRAVRVVGDSMRPAMRVGDVAIYRCGQPVGTGDVVVYRCGRDSRVIHRVSSVDGEGRVRTRGDANTVSDRDPLEAGAVEGKVLFVLPTGWPARVDLPMRGATLLSQLDRWL
jgi:signal peptidase